MDASFNKSRRFKFVTQQLVLNKHCCVLWFVCTKICCYLSQAVHLWGSKNIKYYYHKTCVSRCISASSFSPSFSSHPPFLQKNASPTPPPPPPKPCSSWYPSQQNTKFYDDTPESGRLKKINIKPWKPITCRNSVS